MAVTCVCTCGHSILVIYHPHSNLVIYHPIPSKFHILITSIKLSPKLEYGFFPMNDNQDGRLLSVYGQFALVDTDLVI